MFKKRLGFMSAAAGVAAALAGVARAEPSGFHESARAAFHASLAASRARAGDTRVNGVVNVLVEPHKLANKGDVMSPITTAAPATVIDSSQPVTRVNVVVQASSRVVVEMPTTAPREVELVPVMTRMQYEITKAVMPLGAVVLPEQNALRPVEVVSTVELGDVVVRK